MKIFSLSVAVLLACAMQTFAVIRYVDVNSAAPTPPFTNWTTAANDIQMAIDVADSGDMVVVTNGVFNTGGRIVSGSLSNRVVVDKAIAVTSVNGPGVTVIEGYQVPGNVTGAGAIRCVYLTNEASLMGFTLRNGATESAGDWRTQQSGGGVWCAANTVVISNCVLSNNAAADSGGGVLGGTLNQCSLSGNWSLNAGGGAYNSTLNNCLLIRNNADWGGGGVYGDSWAAPSTLNNCLLTGNTAGYLGGGSYGATLNGCVLSNNVATDEYYHDGYAGGGGAERGVLKNCLVVGNSAPYGGGVESVDIYNSLIVDNRAVTEGGGLSYCLARNCTVTRNSAGYLGGGSSAGNLQNCIVYYNSAPGAANYEGLGCSSCDPVNHSCITPLPTGTGNISVDPQFTDDFHLSATSPCRGAGIGAIDFDLDGEPWEASPSMGCDAFHEGSAVGSLSVSIDVSETNVATGFLVDFRSRVQGHASAMRWDFGDGTIISNLPALSHGWSVSGDYIVTLTVFNDTALSGVSAVATIHVLPQTIHYVDLASTNPAAPYATWNTAATNIQDAIDASVLAGDLVLVTNGIYATGGRVVGGAITNRIAITRPITVQSVNGPEVTVIDGSNIMRCVYATNGATLNGFTVRNGSASIAGDAFRDKSGGGVWCEAPGAKLVNCNISDNVATNTGGGVFRGLLTNCVVTRNRAGGTGGGVQYSTLEGSNVSSNSSISYGGGADGSSLNNCVIHSNSASAWGGGIAHARVNKSIVSSNFSSGSGGGVYNSMVNQTEFHQNIAAGTGGGVTFSRVDNSLFIGNTSLDRGGGAAWGMLNNCTVSSNTASGAGGGVYDSAMENCIVYYNSASSAQNYGSPSDGEEPVNNSCSFPLITGINNFTNAPLFVDVSAGDFRLTTNSPCINAGDTASAGSSFDLDGNARVVGGHVDVGAYEFQSPTSVLPYVWLQRYGFTTDGSADFVDLDQDGLSNWQEWRAGTTPTNSLSVLRMLSPLTTATGISVTWESVSGISYRLERSTNLVVPAFFTVLQNNIAGQGGITTVVDTNAIDNGPFFYRVGVQ